MLWAANLSPHHLEQIDRWFRKLDAPRCDGWLGARQLVSAQVAEARTVVVSGIHGSGKTQLATCVAFLWIRDRDRSAMYYTAHELANECDSLSPSGAAGLVKTCVARGLLVIDDLQDPATTEARRARVATIVEQRHRSKRPTLMLTALDEYAIEDLLGPSAWRRVADHGGLFQCDWSPDEIRSVR